MNTPEHQRIPDQSEQQTHIPKFRVGEKRDTEGLTGTFKVTIPSSSFLERLLYKDRVVYKGFATDHNDAISRAISALKVQEAEEERKRQSTINPDTLEVTLHGQDLLSTITGKRKFSAQVLTSFPEWITVMQGRFRDRSDARNKAQEIIQQRLNRS